MFSLFAVYHLFEMHILPVRTPLLTAGDDLAVIIAKVVTMHDGDIIVVSSKAVATVEGALIDLQKIRPTDEARKWATKCGQTPEFRQAVLDETERMHGTIVGSCPFAMFTSLQPDGFGGGSLLCANAGMDLSNVEAGHAIGWPKDPVASVRRIHDRLQASGEWRVAVIMTDSCCMPARIGVVAFALTICGIDPLFSRIGEHDLFGKTMRVTKEAVADQLATAANFVMGNSDQSTPAAVIRDHGIAMNDFCGWVGGIRPEEDLFGEMMQLRR